MSVAVYQASLFDAPPEPVLAASGGWITGLLGGPLMVSLCVIAVALMGMLMLTGRLHLRRGTQVVVGCFLLLGASAFAGGLIEVGTSAAPEPSALHFPSEPVATPMAAATSDHHSGASLQPD